MPCIKYNINGYNTDNPKLINASFIRWNWVFLYIPQKHVKYNQNKIRNKKINIKDKINFKIILFNILELFSFIFIFNLFICKILFSVKDKYFIIILRKEEIIVEYIIFGIW